MGANGNFSPCDHALHSTRLEHSPSISKNKKPIASMQPVLVRNKKTFEVFKNLEGLIISTLSLPAPG